MLGEPPTLVGNHVFGLPSADDTYQCGFVLNNTQGIRVPEGKEQEYKAAWTAWADYITDKHKHGDVTLDAWTEADSLPSSGAYYLTKDVEVSSQTTISGTLTLCLNGCKIDAKQSGRIFLIESGGSLTLYDCGSGKKGTLTGGSINDGNGGGAIYIDGGSFIMNGGIISGNTADRGGIYASFTSAQKGSVTLNGPVDITENAKTDGTVSNIYLAKNVSDSNISKLTIGSDFSTNTPIGVSIATPPTDCANPVTVATGAVTDEVYKSLHRK